MAWIRCVYFVIIGKWISIEPYLGANRLSLQQNQVKTLPFKQTLILSTPEVFFKLSSQSFILISEPT